MNRLHPDYPFVECEVLYSVLCEMAVKPNDVICRRVPVSFIDEKATKEEILPKVVTLMGDELKWSQERRDKETEEAIKGLPAMK